MYVPAYSSLTRVLIPSQANLPVVQNGPENHPVRARSSSIGQFEASSGRTYEAASCRDIQEYALIIPLF